MAFNYSKIKSKVSAMIKDKGSLITIQLRNTDNQAYNPDTGITPDIDSVSLYAVLCEPTSSDDNDAGDTKDTAYFLCEGKGNLTTAAQVSVNNTLMEVVKVEAIRPSVVTILAWKVYVEI